MKYILVLFACLLLFSSCQKDEIKTKDFDLSAFSGARFTAENGTEYQFSMPLSVSLTYEGKGVVILPTDIGSVSRWYSADIPLVGQDIEQKQEGGLTVTNFQSLKSGKICFDLEVDWNKRWRYVLGNLVDIGQPDGLSKEQLCWAHRNGQFEYVLFRDQKLQE